MASVRSGHATWYLDVTLVSQNIAGNFSTVNVHFYAIADSGWSGNASGIGFSVSSYGTSSFSFNGTSIEILNQTFNVNHNADGSYGTVTVTAHANATGTSTYGGPVDIGQSLGIPTIPRASTASFSPNPIVAGSPVTIYSNRASSAFTHTVTYRFGNKTGTALTGLQAAAAWTPPLDLLDQIPNSVSGTGVLTTTTYNGGTVVGSTTTGFTLTAPSTVIPTIGSITCTEATAGVDAAVGGFVQGISKLNLAIVGAAGIYGSTITASKLTVDGQTINAATGTTAAITSSGALTVTATVTDSRGRTATMTLPVTVLAYAPPSITSALVVKRAYSDSTLHDDGTWLNAAFGAAVQSLKPTTTEKNQLGYRISTRQHGTSAWAVAATVTPGGISFNGSKTIGNAFGVTNSWDVLVEVYDLFTTTAIQTTVTTSVIFQHWDGSAGMGVGKYREQGMLDVAGQIYQNSGSPVIDSASLAAALAVLLPPGSMTMTAVAAAPAGWLLCDGSAVSRSTYPALFAAIGTTYGAGDGSTTFNLPSLKGRVPVGIDASQAEFNAVGKTGGEKAHVLTTAEMPSHTHTIPNEDGQPPRRGAGPSAGRVAGVTFASYTDNSVSTGAAGTGQAHNNLQPYIALNYLIKS